MRARHCEKSLLLLRLGFERMGQMGWIEQNPDATWSIRVVDGVAPVRAVLAGLQEASMRKVSRFVASFVYALPLGRGRRFGGGMHRAVDAFIGGWQIQGVEAASHYYFGKRARDLELAESALLAGLVAAPNLFDPFTHRDQALSRRRTVLQAMVREGHLGVAAAEAIGASALPAAARRFFGIGLRGFKRVDYVAAF